MIVSKLQTVSFKDKRKITNCFIQIEEKLLYSLEVHVSFEVLSQNMYSNEFELCSLFFTLRYNSVAVFRNYMIILISNAMR